MEKVKILLEIPVAIKTKLDRLRAQGTTASGLIRHLLTQHFNPPTKGQKGSER